MRDSEALSASLEDYLEAIFHIVGEKQAARAKDICKRLKVRSSSVTGALRSLAEKQLINYAPYDVITLTPEGRTIAEDVVRRHEALRDFFVKVLLVKNVEAEEAACKMEHAIPPNILERFIQFVDFVDVCPRGGAEWIKGFGYHCKHGEKWEECEQCVSLLLKDMRKTRRRGGSVSRRSVTLRDLKPGEKGRILKVPRRSALKQQIADAGLIHGTLVEVERVTASGDAIEVKAKGYHMSLSEREAREIVVEPL